MPDQERSAATRSLNARGLYERGHLLEAARREADACDRDGYDVTAQILRDLADEVEELRSERILGEQTQTCPDPSCSVVSVGTGYTACPRCGGELVPSD